MPLLSIITINLNDAEGLASTASSIKTLTFRDFEWLVIDGQSTDASLEVIRRTQPDRFVSEQDRGRYDAMNKGIRMASGNYAIFMNSGDRFHNPESLGFLADMSGDAALLQGNAVFEEGGDRFSFVSHIDGPFSFVRHNPFCHQSLVYHLPSLRSLGGYKLDYPVSADFELTYRYFLKHGCRNTPGFIAVFGTGGFGRQNQLKSLGERLRALYASGPRSVFLLALVFAPYVLVKFAAIAALEPPGVLRVYRRARSWIHRLMGYRDTAGPSSSVVMLGVRIQSVRIRERGAVSFVNPYSLLRVVQSDMTDDDLGKITFYTDGIFLCWLARLFYGTRLQRLSFDFTSVADAVLADANRRQLRIAIVGGTDASSAGFARYMTEHYPGIQLDLTRNGYFADSEESQLLARTLTMRSPDIVLLGMGGGAQEQFALQAVNAGFTGRVYTCGGFFDQTASSGRIYYPAWINRMNLRWLYRIYREPRRLLLRYAIEYPRFLIVLACHGSSRP